MADQNDDFELVRGSGNVFADFDMPDASIRQFRAILAAEIVKTLDAERLTVRDAEARTGIEGGLGIGLTLVRQLVQLHGGRVTAHSEGEGKGSTFTVHLPLVPVAQPVGAGTTAPVA